MFAKYKIWLIHLLSVTCLFAEQLPFQGISFLSNSPQHMYRGKDLTMWHERLYQHENSAKNMFHVAFTAGYSQSFKNAQIAETLFGSSILNIAGSAIQTRANNALVADYFGLSPQFESTVLIRPSIKTGLISADFVWSLERYCKGLYIKTALPLCVSSWSLDLHEIINPETVFSAFPAGYMNVTVTPTNPATQSFVKAINGQAATGTLQALTKGKMDDHRRCVGLADIPLVIGWQAMRKGFWSLAFELTGSIPTGTKPKSNYLFEPIIGNERKPIIGAGVVSDIQLWQDLEQYMQLYLTGHLYHFFKGTQYRSFDFKKNGFLSRYLLVKEFDAQQNATGAILPAINITTLKCHVHNAIVFDGTVLFAYTHNNFFTDLGYNGFIKSKDRIELAESIPVNKYGIKGTQYIFNPSTNTLDNTTTSTIKITEGSLIDQTIFADSSTVFISTQDLCIHSAQMPLSVVHTFFCAIGYRKQIEFTDQILPFCGLGAEVSLEGLDLDHFSSITKHSISQWSLYLKGGFSY